MPTTTDLIPIWMLQARHAELAKDAGVRLRHSRSGDPALPLFLDPQNALAARALMESSAGYFEARLKEGTPVAFVTVCHPHWIRAADELDPSVIEQALKWTRRRCQRLNLYGQTLAVGAVDVSWNDDRAKSGGRFWCVHSHLLITTENVPASSFRDIVHESFRCPTDPRIDGNGPLVVSLLGSSSDVRETLRYSSGACALVDQNRSKRRHERKRKATDNVSPDDLVLRPKRQAEFTRLMNDVGSRGFIILSGLQRRGDRLNLVPSKVAQRLQPLRMAEAQAEASRVALIAARKESMLNGKSEIHEMHARVLGIAADYHEARSTRIREELLEQAKSTRIPTLRSGRTKRRGG